jgi:hypothetical protein
VISSAGRRRLVVLTAIVALAAAAAGGAAGDSTSVGTVAESTTFRDAVGEDPIAPDIGTVVVSNDNSRLLTFRIEIPSHPFLTEDLRIRVWLDTDADSETGLRGADRYLLVDRWELGLGEVALFTCGITTCSGGKALPTRFGPPLRFTYSNGATFIVEAADLGIQGPQRIVFWIEAWSGVAFDPLTRRYDLTNARPDFAPDGAARRLDNPGAQGEDAWIHDSGTMYATSFTAQPARPRAGKQFSLRLAAISTQTGAPVTSGTASCSMRIAGKPLRPTSKSFAGGNAVCTFSIPAGTKRKDFRSTIVLRSQGETLPRTISGRVG